MIQFKFGTKDMDKLQKKFERLQRKELREKTYERLRKLTDIVMEDAKRRAPVKTGALRDSVTARTWKRSRSYNKMRGVVYADYPKTGRVTKSKTKKQAAGAPVYYAFAVEYGTRHVKARPFLRPALASKAQLIEREMNEMLKEAVTND
ncbi:HK97-gp10 family putative phage morphogenesis protein [Cloacibacillus sp. An23]|uniref:HK97-gp10 family putative phage morphogenesis protein n=1 Tax=Cloacibacillus sp. An23 TaxID=1965591 RepID=UPI00130254B3|nr:HK97-gp10 family putative phage morphogenesis protein [Cloacibacillus sp. An23]